MGFAVELVVGEAAPGLNTGGLGRFAVLSPVVSGRYGPGGGLFASSSALLCASCLSCRRCLADPAGAAAVVDGVWRDAVGLAL